MSLDFVSAVASETLGGVQGQQALHEVTSLVRVVHIFFVVIDLTSEDVLEHLLRRLVVERW
jgi:hypothetical protein